MIKSVGKNKIANDIIQVKNVFSKPFVNFLIDDCQKQLEFNLKSNLDIRNTKCILDCHGLSICDKTLVKKDPQFPYSIKNWNIFCVKMQNIMFKYCDQFNIDKSEITPHGCWVDSSTFSNKNIIQIKLHDADDWTNSLCNVTQLTHYRIVYFLKNPNPKFGLELKQEYENFFLEGKENSLYIIPTNTYNCYANYPTNTQEKLVLMFNWYLHPKESLELPTWKFPNKYNYKIFKTYIKDSLESNIAFNDSQKTLYKFYLTLFQKIKKLD
jgi:hypothetical protein